MLAIGGRGGSEAKFDRALTWPFLRADKTWGVLKLTKDMGTSCYTLNITLEDGSMLGPFMI